jgi:hypothetical protein
MISSAARERGGRNFELLQERRRGEAKKENGIKLHSALTNIHSTIHKGTIYCIYL